MSEQPFFPADEPDTPKAGEFLLEATTSSHPEEGSPEVNPPVGEASCASAASQPSASDEHPEENPQVASEEKEEMVFPPGTSPGSEQAVSPPGAEDQAPTPEVATQQPEASPLGGLEEVPQQRDIENLEQTLSLAEKPPVEAPLQEVPEVQTTSEPPQPVVAPSASGSPSPPSEEKPSEKPPKSDKMDWYILKVQTNREDSIREGLLRRAAIAGVDHYFGEIIIPTEKVTEFKGGKKRITNRKLYPGYLVIQMELNEDTWFLVRDTPGVGDFAGAAGRPSPLLPHEINRILAKKEEKTDEAPKLKIGFQLGDRVKITEGTFENFEGEVSSIDETNGRVTVMISIFNRTTPVEFEYWQLERV